MSETEYKQMGKHSWMHLEKRGVRHIEVRILDLNPFEKLGLSVEQMNFLQIFMLYCLV